MPNGTDTADLVKEVVYAEYVRLHATIDATVNGSFTDFATLAVLGSMFAWEPFARRILARSNKQADTGRVLCIGFVVMLAVLAIIATRDLLKQSIVIFNARETVPYEEVLRAHLGSVGTSLFRTSEHFWPWLTGTFGTLSMHFRGLVIGLGVFFPLVVLASHGWRYMALFASAAAVLLLVYFNALRSFASAVPFAGGA